MGISFRVSCSTPLRRALFRLLICSVAEKCICSSYKKSPGTKKRFTARWRVFDRPSKVPSMTPPSLLASFPPSLQSLAYTSTERSRTPMAVRPIDVPTWVGNVPVRPPYEEAFYHPPLLGFFLPAPPSLQSRNCVYGVYNKGRSRTSNDCLDPLTSPRG
jgi:hypothetical protein